MVMVRLFRVILAEHGGLRETKRKSIMVGETNNGHGEDSIQMVELDNEDEGGETLSDTTLVEEGGTTQKRGPARKTSFPLQIFLVIHLRIIFITMQNQSYTMPVFKKYQMKMCL